MEDLPISSDETRKLLDARVEAIFQLYKFRDRLEEEGQLTKEALYNFIKKIHGFTQEIVVLEKRLMDCLEWEGCKNDSDVV